MCPSASAGSPPSKPADDLIQIAFEEHEKNVELALIHLRDARNILYSIPDLHDNRALSKSAILLATSALESNLTYLAGIALRFIEARPGKFSKPHTAFVRGIELTIDENGRLVERRVHQTLLERMRIVPEILARAIDRHFVLSSRSAAAKKMRRTIARRDAIIHPTWNRYVSMVGWWEAAEAVDAVELYLNSVRASVHPYLIGYTHMLWTIKGPTKHDMGIGHRTFGKRGPAREISTMAEKGIVEVMSGEWFDSMFMTHIALGDRCEADSPGSMLTRAALVLLYAMLDAQLAVVSQWRMRDMPAAFTETEVLFLNEAAVGIGHDGEVWIDSDQHPFKKRVKAVPAVLARCVDQVDFVIDLGKGWGQALLNGHSLRSQVMHFSPGSVLPRVSKDELRSASDAVHAYFRELAQRIPKTFGHMEAFLDDAGDVSAALATQFSRNS
jgi:hypothetical protein